ncbi:hypothetical protein [Deefgea rivuli]|uniref:hypothetical protein n=1 Tax=Deefgea rivuli TaxID=400948 RepID=UPI0012EC60FF|nr:hypothetical protein [Deefgea rivuli]
MNFPPKHILIDALLTDNFYNVVSRFLDGKWGELPSVWNLSFDEVIQEGIRRGVDCFIIARPIHEGYWLSKNEDKYVVQYFERGTNFDICEFIDLNCAFKHYLQCKINYYQLQCA